MPDGFDALFTAHYALVHRIAYRIVGTREEAEDLAQEAFLRLHRSPAVWQGKAADDGSVRAWLCRVVTNLAYNALRAQGRRTRREVQIAPAEDHADASAAVAEVEAVRQALVRLDARQVQLLLLRQEGLTYRELAAALNVAPGSVGTLLARAEAAFARAYRKVVTG